MQEWVQLKELELKLKNKMTEKDYNPKQKEKKAMKKQQKVENKKTPVETPKKKEDKSKQENEELAKKKIENEKAKEIEEKKPMPVKKAKAVVYGRNLPISTLHSIAICKFIRNKKITEAIKDLEEVLMHKKAIPMKGELPHRKGKIMSGRYADKSVKNFIKLLKSLQGNANSNNIEEPIIIESTANIASRPYGKFGRVRKKRTHVKILAKEKLNSKNKK